MIPYLVRLTAGVAYSVRDWLSCHSGIHSWSCRGRDYHYARGYR